jgi:hypothetical protein
MPVHKNLKQHKLLLDTHVWIWVMLGDNKISRSFRLAIEQNKGNTFISAISIPRAVRFLNFWRRDFMSQYIAEILQTWISLQDRAMSWDAKDADEKFKDLSARGIYGK